MRYRGRHCLFVDVYATDDQMLYCLPLCLDFPGGMQERGLMRYHRRIVRFGHLPLSTLLFDNFCNPADISLFA